MKKYLKSTVFKEGMTKKGGVNPPPSCPKPDMVLLPQNSKSESHSSQVQQGPIISNKKLRVNFSVIGYVEELTEFVKLLQVIQWCETVGTNRTIYLHVDGDESGRLDFIDTTSDSRIPPLEPVLNDRGRIHLYIGEE